MGKRREHGERLGPRVRRPIILTQPVPLVL